MGRIPGGAGIDIHVHLNDDAAAQAAGGRREQMARYFGHERKTVSADELAEQYRARNMIAVLMNSIDVTTSGNTRSPTTTLPTPYAATRTR